MKNLELENFEPFLASFMFHWCPNADSCDDHVEDKYYDKAFLWLTMMTFDISMLILLYDG